MSKRTATTRIVGMIAAGIAMVFLAGGPAHAGTATMSRTIWLLKWNSGGMASAGIDRDIVLNGDTYEWQVTTTRDSSGSNYGTATRTIYLAAGNYHWSCEITNPAENGYQNFCSLRPSSGDTAWLASVIYAIPGSGDYTLTSRLTALYK
ncbi:hypothetical protein [Streptomyces sp. NPDC096339]|uniref:hypothetical protein n=1 Tax=Streptomyces sp. NPDC096339 TaxID=3366086 RepID=UPI0037F38321